MRTPRFLIPEITGEALEAGEVTISGEDFAHLKNVLRLGTGNNVELIDGSGNFAFLAELSSVGPSSATARLKHKIEAPEISPMTLVAGLCKPKTVDFIVEKAVELGISEIAFFTAERSQERLSSEKAKARSDRFERIMAAALKQSGVGKKPELTFHESLRQALTSLHPGGGSPAAGELRLLCATPADSAKELENKDFFSRKSVLSELRAGEYALENISKNADSFIVIGPEGGLTEIELNEAARFAYRPLSLGPKTLRAETAVIAACTLVSALRQ